MPASRCSTPTPPCTALQAHGGRALPAIAAAFPGTVRDDRLDRAALRAAVLGHPEALARLERIVHPLVRAEPSAPSSPAPAAPAAASACSTSRCCSRPAGRRTDLVVVVSAPRDVQVHRVRQRRRMSTADVAAVIARQMPDAEKRRRADVVVRTGLSRHHAQRRLRAADQGAAGMSRSVLFDTETTGLDPAQGDRVIEVAVLELMNDLPTGRHFHRLIDPERDVPGGRNPHPRLHPRATWWTSRASPRSPTS